MLSQLSQFPPLPPPPAPPFPQSCCPGPWAMHTCPLSSPSPPFSQPHPPLVQLSVCSSFLCLRFCSITTCIFELHIHVILQYVLSCLVSFVLITATKLHLFCHVYQQFILFYLADNFHFINVS